MITTSYSGYASCGLTSFFKDGKLVAHIQTRPHPDPKKNIVIIETVAVMEFAGSEKTDHGEFPYRSECFEWNIYNNVAIMTSHRVRHMMYALTGNINWLW